MSYGPGRAEKFRGFNISSLKHRWRRNESLMATSSASEEAIAPDSGGWLFAFCVAALNDVCVDEVSFNDMEARIGASRKFTPLLYEMLASASPTNPDALAECHA